MKKYYRILSVLVIILFLNTLAVFGASEFDNPAAMFENHKSVMLLIDAKSGTIINANQAAEGFYGYSRNELMQMTIGDINTLSDQEVANEMEAALLEKRNYFEFKHQLKDGSIRDVEVYSSPANDKDGNTILFSIVHDITEKKLAQMEASQSKLMAIYLLAMIIAILLVAIYIISRIKRAEQASKDKIKSLFDNMNEGFALHEIILNRDGIPVDYRFLDVNRSFEEITGIKLEVVKNKTVKEVLPDTEEYWIKVYGEVALKGTSTIFTNYAAQLDKYFNVNVYSPLQNHFVTIFTDITAEKRIQESIEKERNLFETTLHSIGDAVISTDSDGRIEVMNAVAEKLTGWTKAEAKGQPFRMVFNIINGESHKACDNPVDKVFETGEIIELENDTVLISKNKGEISIEDSAAPICDEKGQIKGVVVVFRDCTEKKEKQQKIQYLSYHDQLTGLYNRHFFEAELQRLDVNRNLPLTIVMADVNGLKLTNDAFGHKTGDLLLKSVAKVLEKEFRADDIISRVGGDEFVIILPKTSRSEAALLVERIYEVFEHQKIDHIIVSVSIGWDTKEKSQVDIKEIFAKAEDNMYHRKITESQTMRNTTIKHIMETLRKSSLQEKIHIERVSQISRKIGQAMQMDEEMLDELETMGLMHDIGKIAIAQRILDKPGSLAKEDNEEVKKHPEIGYHILKSVDVYTKLSDSVLSHHERWDGQGYPRGLSGEEIPLAARIVMVADAYEAMTSGRPYQQAFSHERAMDELKRCSGTQFDPEIVDLCESYPWLLNS